MLQACQMRVSVCAMLTVFIRERAFIILDLGANQAAKKLAGHAWRGLY